MRDWLFIRQSQVWLRLWGQAQHHLRQHGAVLSHLGEMICHYNHVILTYDMKITHERNMKEKPFEHTKYIKSTYLEPNIKYFSKIFLSANFFQPSKTLMFYYFLKGQVLKRVRTIFDKNWIKKRKLSEFLLNVIFIIQFPLLGRHRL